MGITADSEQTFIPPCPARGRLRGGAVTYLRGSSSSITWPRLSIFSRGRRFLATIRSRPLAFRDAVSRRDREASSVGFTAWRERGGAFCFGERRFAAIRDPSAGSPERDLPDRDGRARGFPSHTRPAITSRAGGPQLPVPLLLGQPLLLSRRDLALARLPELALLPPARFLLARLPLLARPLRAPLAAGVQLQRLHRDLGIGAAGRLAVLREELLEELVVVIA